MTARVRVRVRAEKAEKQWAERRRTAETTTADAEAALAGSQVVECGTRRRTPPLGRRRMLTSDSQVLLVKVIFLQNVNFVVAVVAAAEVLCPNCSAKRPFPLPEQRRSSPVARTRHLRWTDPSGNSRSASPQARAAGEAFRVPLAEQQGREKAVNTQRMATML